MASAETVEKEAKLLEEKEKLREEKIKNYVPPGTPFNVKFGEASASVYQFLGVGTLNVDTGRGEVKAKPGDFIVTLPHCKLVIPQNDFETFDLDVKLIPLDEYVDSKVLNAKSGPDKFSPPFDLPLTEAEKNPPQEEKADASLPHTSTSTATRTTRSAPVTRA